jgi:hypothetical protein
VADTVSVGGARATALEMFAEWRLAAEPRVRRVAGPGRGLRRPPELGLLNCRQPVLTAGSQF